MKQAGERALAYALLMPALACVLALVLYPLGKVIDLSLRVGRTMNFARIDQLPLAACRSGGLDHSVSDGLG